MSTTKRITVIGVASNRVLSFDVSKEYFQKNLLLYLREDLNLPVASACGAERVCRKCIFNENELLCSYTVEDIKEKIVIDYL